jgi:NAD(P)-dependent dehydrogenase (short-subunit alcohol dehydrogenase family)
LNKKRVLIIGGDSGLSKSLSLYFLLNNIDVTSTTRKKNDKMRVYLNLKNENLNLKMLSKQLKNKKFDYVLFVAAITTRSKEIKNKNCTFGSFKFSDFLSLMDVNCFTNLKVFEYLKKKNFLQQNALIVFFSSLAGSIEHRGKLKHNKPFGNLFYRLSKAALNCGVKNLSYDFQNRYTIVALHPGYVKTKSGGKNADYEVSYAAEKIFKTLINVSKKDNGSFIDLYGKKLKW